MKSTGPAADIAPAERYWIDQATVPLQLPLA
jgi:hypothetical protein